MSLTAREQIIAGLIAGASAEAPQKPAGGMVLEDGVTSTTQLTNGLTGTGGGQIFTAIYNFKRHVFGADQRIAVWTANSGQEMIQLKIDTSDRLDAILIVGNTVRGRLITNRVFRDDASAYQIAWVVKTDHATQADRHALYVLHPVNGWERLDDFSTETQVTSAVVTVAAMETADHYEIGHTNGTTNRVDITYFEEILLDGLALTETELNSDYAQVNSNGYYEFKVRPTSKPSGVNSHYHAFEDSDNIGLDKWGNGTYASGTGIWTGATANMDGSTPNEISFDTNNVAAYVTAALSGDFEVSWIYANDAGSGNGHNCGVFSSSDVGTFNSSHNNGDMQSMTDSFWFQASSDQLKKANTNIHTPALIEGDELKIRRVGSTFTFYQNGALIHTAASETTSDMHVCFGSGNSSAFIQSLRWITGTDNFLTGLNLGFLSTLPGWSPDSPTINLITWSSLQNDGSPTFTDGNRTVSLNASTEACYSTLMIPATGKWYCEGQNSVMHNANTYIGFIRGPAPDTGNYFWSNSGNGAYGINDWEALVTDGVQSGGAGSQQISTGDTVLWARHGAKLWLGYDDGATTTWVGGGDPAAGTSPTFTLTGSDATAPLYLCFASGSTTAKGCELRPSEVDWIAQSQPSGFLAMSAKNIYDNMITNGGVAKPRDYYRGLLYDGNGTAIGSGGKVVDVGIPWDALYVKNRDAADSAMWGDRLQGVGKHWRPDLSEVQQSDSEAFAAFSANGVTFGNNVAVNTSGESYVIRAFRTLDGFFAQLQDTGTGVARDVAHGLGAIPGMSITRSVTGTAYSPNVYHEGGADDPETDYWRLDTNVTFTDDAGTYDDTAPDATNQRVGTDVFVNASAIDFLRYYFGNKPGLCALGYYYGNSSTNGVIINLGFRPAFFMNKGPNTGAWEQWESIRHPEGNPINARLTADGSAAESNGVDQLDFLSTGVKWRASGTSRNNSGVRYIFAAFAEDPRQLIAA